MPCSKNIRKLKRKVTKKAKGSNKKRMDLKRKIVNLTMKINSATSEKQKGKKGSMPKGRSRGVLYQLNFYLLPTKSSLHVLPAASS